MERHVYPRTVVSVSYHYKNPTQCVGLEQSDLIIITLKINLFSPWHSLKIAELVLNSTHSLTQAFLTGENQIIHVSVADYNLSGNDTPDIALPVQWWNISGVAYSKASVKMENFWKVVGNSVAKKNNDIDKIYMYVFQNNIIILYLRY